MPERKSPTEKRGLRANSVSAPPNIPLVSLVEEEVEAIIAKLSVTRDPTKVDRLRRDLSKLRKLIAVMREDVLRRRKPPEAGLAVPATPPKGPAPKHGGAAAPLDFGAD